MNTSHAKACHAAQNMPQDLWSSLNIDLTGKLDAPDACRASESQQHQEKWRTWEIPRKADLLEVEAMAQIFRFVILILFSCMLRQKLLSLSHCRMQWLSVCWTESTSTSLNPCVLLHWSGETHPRSLWGQGALLGLKALFSWSPCLYVFHRSFWKLTS